MIAQVKNGKKKIIANIGLQYKIYNITPNQGSEIISDSINFNIPEDMMSNRILVKFFAGDDEHIPSKYEVINKNTVKAFFGEDNVIEVRNLITSIHIIG